MAFSTDMAPYLSLRDQLRIEITMPDICKQQCIAAVLGALDDKIELNRRMNETLEAMAQAIFRDWFVDFGPTRRQMAGATDPVQIMGGLTPDPINAATLGILFPPTLAVNGLPEGWAYERIGRHVTARKGLSYKGSGLTREGNGIPLHNLNSIFEGGGYKDSGLKYYSGEFKERHTVRPGDLIVANTEQGFEHLVIG